MKCILKGIINKVFLKVLSVKFLLKYFLSILGILSVHFSLKGNINKTSFKEFSFNSWNNPYFKIPKVAHSLLALSIDLMWLIACWHFQKTKSGS